MYLQCHFVRPTREMWAEIKTKSVQLTNGRAWTIRGHLPLGPTGDGSEDAQSLVTIM